MPAAILEMERSRQVLQEFEHLSFRVMKGEEQIAGACLSDGGWLQAPLQVCVA